MGPSTVVTNRCHFGRPFVCVCVVPYGGERWRRKSTPMTIRARYNGLWLSRLTDFAELAVILKRK